MTNITGIIKVVDVPDDAVLTDVRSLILSLKDYLAVEFDVDRITNVVVSSDEPQQTERDIVWFRLNNSGNFVGIFIFAQGQWIQMFPAPNSIELVYGNSSDLPLGYELVSDESAGFTAAMVAKLKEQWLLAPNGVDYVIFHIVYRGL